MMVFVCFIIYFLLMGSADTRCCSNPRRNPAVTGVALICSHVMKRVAPICPPHRGGRWGEGLGSRLLTYIYMYIYIHILGTLTVYPYTRVYMLQSRYAALTSCREWEVRPAALFPLVVRSVVWSLGSGGAIKGFVGIGDQQYSAIRI